MPRTGLPESEIMTAPFPASPPAQSSASSCVHILHEIRALPLPLDEALFRHYPGMKFGRPQHLSFFSRQLALVAQKLVRQAPRHDWVLTAPPYFQLPAAANLLAGQVQQILLQQGLGTALYPLRLQAGKQGMRNAQEFANAYNYSKNSLAQRVAERERVQQMLDTDGLASALQGKQVIVINDINVTGTQQKFIQQTMDQMQVAGVHWLYIFQVEPALAASHPEIEHQINTSQLADLDSYAAVLDDSTTQHTARCISRLFNEDMAAFRQVLARLSPRAMEQIYRLARLEERYDSEIFAEKMALLGEVPCLV